MAHVRRCFVALVGSWVAATTSTARAQDAPDGTAVTVATPVAEPYPLVYNERPLTLPSLMAEVFIGANYWWVEREENVAATSATAKFGVTDGWQVAASTYTWLAPDRDWGEVVGLATRVRALDTAWVDLAPGISAPVVFADDPETGRFPSIALDAHTRIIVWRRGPAAVYFGDNLVPIGLGDNASVSIDLNAAIVSQMGKHVALRLSQQLFHIHLHGDTRESHGLAAPLGTMLIVSPTNWLDVRLGYEVSSDVRGVVVAVAGRL